MKKSKQDCVAHERGRADQEQSSDRSPRSARDPKQAVQRLEELAWNRDVDGTELFKTRVVADFLGGSIKVIRSLARRRLLEGTKIGRQFFFTVGAVIKFTDSFWSNTSLLNARYYGACFRSEKIAADRDFVNGRLIPKALVGDLVNLSIRAIERSIENGELEAVRIGKMTLVKENSFLEFRKKRGDRAYLRYVLARERMETARKDFDAALYEDGISKEFFARELGLSNSRVDDLVKSGVLETFQRSRRTFILGVNRDKLPALDKETRTAVPRAANLNWWIGDVKTALNESDGQADSTPAKKNRKKCLATPCRA